MTESKIDSNGGVSLNQEQTRDSFGYKWKKTETFESAHVAVAGAAWLFERYCQGEPKILDQWLSGGEKKILDAGCGAGYSALLFFAERLKQHKYFGVDISEAVVTAKQRFAERGIPGEFVQSDLRNVPYADGFFDIIFSEGVLHHTDNTKDSLVALSKKLKPGGKFLFYVYKKKSDIREYTDDLVREKLSKMSNEDAWEALKPLTELGIRLGKIDAEIEVPAVPLLGIESGKMSLQRFFYWHVAKMFYRPEYNFDEMHMINFDWFRPLNCFRHTEEEVREMCSASGLKVDTLNVQEAGITVVATKT